MSPDVHTLTGAYALDALDADERAAFELHLAECSACSHEVAELRATAARLGAAVALTPPENLKQRVLVEISRTRQDTPGGLRAVGSDADPRFARRRKWTVRISLAAAVVAVLVAGAFGAVAINTDNQLHTAQGQLSQAKAQYAPITQLLAAPDVRTASGSADGGSATLLTSHELGKSVLVTEHMPVQPANKTYQAWGIGPAGFHSLGVLGNGSAGTLSVSDLGSAQQVGITIEPAGGSPQPTSAPIVHFAVPA
ncbi:MAG TPA: anti-sigma factor [Pseudonocardiaceae bacterium]|jgi:anti-sigma-K factor RskA|nr:anti-sigma factor [Pseudonocardiaceae bacterium]